MHVFSRWTRRLVCLAAAACAAAQAVPAAAEVSGLRITTDRTVDTTSLETIVRDVIEQSGAKSNDEKAIALYEWLHHTIFHFANVQEPSPQRPGPLKVINVYGWGLCGTQHTVLKALYETAGWECRYVGWSNPPHTTIEVFYDERWHYFDVFLKCYFWTKDRRHVASQEEIAADPSTVFDAVQEGRAARQHLCCGDGARAVVSGVLSRKVVGDRQGWGACLGRDEGYSAALNLPEGASLRLDWGRSDGGYPGTGRSPIHTCGMRDFREDAVLGPLVEHYGPRGWSNGAFTYAPDFAAAGDVADVGLENCQAREGKLLAVGGRGTAIFKLPLPYLYVSGKAAARFDGGGELFVSTDQGKSWKAVAEEDLTPHVRQRYDVWLKAEFSKALETFRVEAVVEHNRYAQPYLLPGKNVVTVSADQDALPQGRALLVTYAYQEATARENRTRFEGKDVSYGEIKTVRREIASLPYTFEIDVSGNTPPKMISLEYALPSR